MARKKSRSKIGRTGCLFWLFILLIILVVLIYKGNLKETFNNIKNAVKPGQMVEETEKKEISPSSEPREKEELIIVEKPEPETSQKPDSPSTISREEEKKSLTEKKSSEEESALTPVARTTGEKQPDIKQKSISVERSKPQPKVRQATLYYVNIDSTGENAKPAPVYRKVQYLDSPITRTVKALLDGPTESERKKGLVSFIPDGTKLISAHIEKSHLTLNFSASFEENYSGKDAIMLEISQVILTCFEFKEVKAVTILIEGKKKRYITGEGIPLKEMYTKHDLSSLQIGG